MPSLIPTLQPEYPDLREVFASEKTRETVERVARYIGAVYEKASNRSESDRNSPYSSVEEFDLLMPTNRAFFDEIALCEAVLRHSEGKLSDLEIKAVLDAYIDSHIYVYRGGRREIKTGDDEWTDCPLVYVYHPENENIAFTCNPVQSWLVWLLHRGENLRVLRLN